MKGSFKFKKLINGRGFYGESFWRRTGLQLEVLKSIVALLRSGVVRSYLLRIISLTVIQEQRNVV